MTGEPPRRCYPYIPRCVGLLLLVVVSLALILSTAVQRSGVTAPPPPGAGGQQDSANTDLENPGGGAAGEGVFSFLTDQSIRAASRTAAAAAGGSAAPGTAAAEELLASTARGFQRHCDGLFPRFTTGRLGICSDGAPMPVTYVSTAADGGNTTVALGPYTAEGEVVCMQGRQVLRTGSTASVGMRSIFGQWKLTGTPGLPALLRSHLAPAEDASEGRNSTNREAVFHGALLVFSAPIFHLFHAWHDSALVGRMFLERFDGGNLLAVPRRAVAVLLNNTPGSVGGDAVLLAMRAGLSHDARAVVNDDGPASTSTLHCYCRALFLDTSLPHLFTDAPQEARTQASRAMAAELYRMYSLPPHGADMTRPEHWMPEGRAFWFPTPPSRTVLQDVAAGRPAGGGGPFVDHIGMANAAGWSLARQAPRLLWIVRTQRRVARLTKHLALARRLGFHVRAVVSEHFTLAEQIHQARYADAVIGMHGMGLVWALTMDGHSRPHCRRVIELRHFGQRLPKENDNFPVMAQDQRLGYDAVDPYFATFPPWEANPAKRIWELQTMPYPFLLKGFGSQTAHYYASLMEATLRRHFDELERCLGLAT